MSSRTSDQLADEVVALLNAAGQPDDPELAPPLRYQAVNPAELAEVYAERGDWGVFVLPWEESESPIDNGDACDERRKVRVIVNGPLRQMKRAKGLELVQFLRLAFREADLTGYRWEGNETLTLIDWEALKKGQFLSMFESEFFGVN